MAARYWHRVPLTGCLKGRVADEFEEERMLNKLDLILALSVSMLVGTQMITAQTSALATSALSCKLQVYDFMKALSNASDELNAKTPQQLSGLRNAIHQIPKDQKLPKDLHDQLMVRCNYFFQDLGDQLRSQFQQELGPEWSRGLRANDIIDAIKGNPAKSIRPSSDWVKVDTPSEAQTLANAGVIVEGLQAGSIDPTTGEQEMGHVATVSPIPENVRQQRESELPLIRDGNEHVYSDVPGRGTKVVFPSSRGAVSYKWAFCQHQTGCIQPDYYAWIPSWNAARDSSVPACSEHRVDQAKTESQKTTARNVQPKGNSHTGAWILVGVLAGGAVAGTAEASSLFKQKNCGSAPSICSIFDPNYQACVANFQQQLANYCSCNGFSSGHDLGGGNTCP